jgi:predicted nucleotidyltransferase
MNAKLCTILAELRRRLETLYGERLIRLLLYGSQARSDAEPGSDIDVLVMLRGAVSSCEEIARTIADVADLSLQYDEVISCVFISDAEFVRKRSPLLLNVRHEGIVI